MHFHFHLAQSRSGAYGAAQRADRLRSRGHHLNVGAEDRLKSRSEVVGNPVSAEKLIDSNHYGRALINFRAAEPTCEISIANLRRQLRA
jgi:hypothetical protein